jgi:predicted DNA-binding protein
VASLNAVARPRLKANINFRLTPELKKAANDRAEERGEDLSDVLRDALEKYVKKGKK